MNALNDNELIDLLGQIKKAREARQVNLDAMELLLDFATELAKVRTHESSWATPTNEPCPQG
jgi:hypothetical protein